MPGMLPTTRISIETGDRGVLPERDSHALDCRARLEQGACALGPAGVENGGDDTSTPASSMPLLAGSKSDLRHLI